MQSIGQVLSYLNSRLNIESTTKEKCEVCNYGMKITIVVDGEVQSKCKYCEDRKLVAALDIPKTTEDRQSHKLQIKAKHFSSVPSDVRDAKLNDYAAVTATQKRAKQEAISFITQFDEGRTLILSGSPGIGKTHIAVAVANALAKENSILFLKSTNLLDLIKNSYGNANYNETDIFKLCSDVDLLVLDDLGAEYAKSGDSESWASDIIYKVIDSRLKKSLIITTNYNESALEQKYGRNGERITSRMSENATKIRVDGNDMRRE